EGGCKSGDLNLLGRERIGYRRCLRADTTDVVHEEAVVANGSAGLQYGIEDVAVLDTEWRIRGGVVTGASQQVGRTARKARRGGAVIGGSSGPGSGVALSDRGKVHRYVAVRPFRLIGQAAVDRRVVDLLSDRFRVGDTTL